MDWSQVTALTIPEGNVKQITVDGIVLWKKRLLPVGYTQLEYISNGNLVENFIPCKRNSDGKVGMYNPVTGEFKSSMTSDNFIAGDNI